MDLALLPTRELVERGRTQAETGKIQEDVLHELAIRWGYRHCPAEDKAIITEFDRTVVIPLLGCTRLTPQVMHLPSAKPQPIPLYYQKQRTQTAGLPATPTTQSELTGGSKKPADFFISYSSKDALTARFLRQWLQEAGYSTFMQDTDFPPASHIIEKMEEGMHASRLLAVVSDNYLNSDYCRAELAGALMRDPLNRASRIVIVRIANCRVPDLWAPISRIELLQTGGQVRNFFLAAIAKLPPVGKPAKKKKKCVIPSLNPSMGVAGAGVTAQASGPGGIAAAAGRDLHFHYGEGKPSRGRPKSPPDVISEEQAVKLKQLMDEVIELDSGSPQGKKLTSGQLQRKWWGALLKVAPASSYTNYSQAKYNKAMHWARRQRARLLAGTADEEPSLAVMSMIRAILTYISRNNLDKRECYRGWSERLHISPLFESLKDLSPEDLKRVYTAMQRDKKVREQRA